MLLTLFNWLDELLKNYTENTFETFINKLCNTKLFNKDEKYIDDIYFIRILRTLFVDFNNILKPLIIYSEYDNKKYINGTNLYLQIYKNNNNLYE